jgi:hypothetical protein
MNSNKPKKPHQNKPKKFYQNRPKKTLGLALGIPSLMGSSPTLTRDFSGIPHGFFNILY